MPDPISLAAGYFLLKTAVSMGMAIKEETTAENIGDELLKAAGGNFYYDLLKSPAALGSRLAWKEISSRFKSEYNSNKPLNHDLQKAVRKAQIEAVLSACESCAEDLRSQETTFFEKLRRKISLNDEEKWLKDVIRSLTLNLAEIKKDDYIPPKITDDQEVLKIADNKNYPLTNESLDNLIYSIKEQTILEIRLANPPNHSQRRIADLLDEKIYKGWTKDFQDETVEVDWYKLLCDRFNEEYKENPRVNAALQKAFFQDIKSDLSREFTGFSKKHFDELGGKILSKLESIEGKQDRLYDFIILFKDETDEKLTEALGTLRTSVSEINTFTEDVVRDAKGEIIEEVRNQFKTQNQQSETRNEKLKEDLRKSFTSYAEENEIKFEEAVQRINKFRRNILAERKLTVIEKLLKNHRFGLFDRIFSNLTPQEEFFVSLKERYTNRYFGKLDNRFEITLLASDDLESEIEREYTGIYEGHGQLNEAFDYMRNAFQDANRLLIIGEPGVGKTVLLLKFANHLSDETVEKLNSRPELRLDDIKDPIPVIFNLASWSEDYNSFSDWLIAMLKTGEGLSEAFADELLRGKKIFLLLDGLDELAKNEPPETAAAIRTKCFHSIAGFLKGGQKAVICCRVNEYRKIRKDIGQDDAEQRRRMPEVFVKNLDVNQIEDALHRASQTEVDRESALNILKLLKTETSGVFLKVLSIPFYFTTALEVFDSSILKERTISANEQDLKDYLIGKLITEKLETSPPNPKRFKHKSSLKWLKWLAKKLKKKDKVTFELADLQPNDLLHPRNFKLLFGISIFFLIYFSICIGASMDIMASATSEVLPIFGEMYDELYTEFSKQLSLPFFATTLGLILIYIFFFFIIFIILLGIVGIFFTPFFFPISLVIGFRTKKILTEDSSIFSLIPLAKWENWRNIIFTILIFSLPIFLFLLTLHKLFNFPQGAVVIISLSVFTLVFLERVTSQCRIVKRFNSLKEDYQRLKTGLRFNFIRWGVVLLLVGFIGEVNNKGISWRIIIEILPQFSSIFGLIILILAICILSTSLFKHIILRICLSIGKVTPVRYATFLNYAAETRILEKDGGVWRFRHQELQDYFAKLP